MRVPRIPSIVDELQRPARPAITGPPAPTISLNTFGAALTTQTTISTTTLITLASVTVPAGVYLVTAQFDWLSVPTSDTWGSVIAQDGSKRRELFLGNGSAFNRIGQSLTWVGAITNTISIMAYRPLGTGSAILEAGTTRLDAVKIG